MYNNADHIKYSNGFLYGKIIIEMLQYIRVNKKFYISAVY